MTSSTWVQQCEYCCRYYETMRRRNYVTPTSYLELIKTFKSLLDHKRMEILTLKNRYIVGLEKLEFSESQVHTVRNSAQSKKKKFRQCSCTNIGIAILIIVMKNMKIDLWWSCCCLTGISKIWENFVLEPNQKNVCTGRILFQRFTEYSNFFNAKFLLWL